MRRPGSFLDTENGLRPGQDWMRRLWRTEKESNTYPGAIVGYVVGLEAQPRVQPAPSGNYFWCSANCKTHNYRR